MKGEKIGYSKSDVSVELMQSIKKMLDPHRIMNPGKVSWRLPVCLLACQRGAWQEKKSGCGLITEWHIAVSARRIVWPQGRDVLDSLSCCCISPRLHDSNDDPCFHPTSAHPA
jgi:hypothetical protein